MIIPFDLQTQAIATDGQKCIISTVYVDIIQILTSPEEALLDPEMQGTISKPKSFAKRANHYGYSRYHQQMSTEKQVLSNTDFIKNTYHILQ